MSRKTFSINPIKCSFFILKHKYFQWRCSLYFQIMYVILLNEKSIHNQKYLYFRSVINNPSKIEIFYRHKSLCNNVGTSNNPETLNKTKTGGTWLRHNDILNHSIYFCGNGFCLFRWVFLLVKWTEVYVVQSP